MHRSIGHRLLGWFAALAFVSGLLVAFALPVYVPVGIPTFKASCGPALLPDVDSHEINADCSEGARRNLIIAGSLIVAGTLFTLACVRFELRATRATVDLEDTR